MFLLANYSVIAQDVILHSFKKADGYGPIGPPALSGKMIYGTTYLGGLYDSGCIFRVDTNGNNFKVLFSFNGQNGKYPHGSVIVAGNKLYGTTSEGGTNYIGKIFSIDTNGNGFKDIFDFDSSSGASPTGNLIFSKGKLYGTTWASELQNEFGTVFSIDTSGRYYKKLISFNGGNGANPPGGLLLSGNVLYGVTTTGAKYYGEVFSVDTNGHPGSTGYAFNGTDGYQPYGGLILVGKALFGMTTSGGANSSGDIFSLDTVTNNFKDVFDFTNENAYQNSLVYAGNTLFGVTMTGGNWNSGIFYSIDTDGNGFNNIFSFSTLTGAGPFGGLIVSGNNLFGITSQGGKYDSGTVYKINYKTVGIDELASVSNGVKLYPDPSGGMVTITFLNHSVIGRQANIEVFNSTGQKIYTREYNSLKPQLTIDLRCFPAGIYLYTVEAQNSETAIAGKFVIE